MSHDGTHFTYVNQLASSAANLSKRKEWFTCACCPPNVLRLFGQLGGYVWKHWVTTSGTSNVAVNLYIPGTLTLNVEGHTVKVIQQSEWPWKGDTAFEVEDPSHTIGLRLRIPGWASEFAVSTTEMYSARRDTDCV